jgi:hypothetical protein
LAGWWAIGLGAFADFVIGLYEAAANIGNCNAFIARATTQLQGCIDLLNGGCGAPGTGGWLSRLKKAADETADAIKEFEPFICPGCVQDLDDLLLEIRSVNAKLEDALAIACALRKELANFDCSDGNWRIHLYDVTWALARVLETCCCNPAPPVQKVQRVAGCQPDGSEWRPLAGRLAGYWLKVLPDGSGETYDPAGNHISPIPDPPGSWFVKCKPAAATVAANPGAVCPPGTRRTAGANGLQAWTYCAPIQPIVPLNQ